MELDPKSEVMLTLPNDTTQYFFHPWTLRDMRAYTKIVAQKDVDTPTLVDNMLLCCQQGFLRAVIPNTGKVDGGEHPDFLETLEFMQLSTLLNERYKACFVTAEDKKKSES